MSAWIPFDPRGYYIFHARSLRDQSASEMDVKYHRGSCKTDASTRKFCKEHGLPDLVTIRDEVHSEEVSE